VTREIAKTTRMTRASAIINIHERLATTSTSFVYSHEATMADYSTSQRRTTRISSVNNTSIPTASATKNRHLAQLHSQLAQLSANLANLDNIVHMTAKQAQSMRDLGAWSGGLYVILLCFHVVCY